MTKQIFNLLKINDILFLIVKLGMMDILYVQKNKFYKVSSPQEFQNNTIEKILEKVKNFNIFKSYCTTLDMPITTILKDIFRLPTVLVGN